MPKKSYILCVEGDEFMEGEEMAASVFKDVNGVPETVAQLRARLAAMEPA